METHGLSFRKDMEDEPRIRVRPADAPNGPAPTLSQVFAAAGRVDSEPESADGVDRVSCPSCRTEYGLPPDLMPPWGGRVRCPRCGAAFSVGPRAEADDMVAAIVSKNPARWQSACERQALWAEWGEPLLEAYAMLRERHGAQAAARALRRALEGAAPGVAWLAPPPAVAVYGEEFSREETMFDRRREC